ncbi:cbb3-type cytochrome oxidase assembly protein CcoS [Thalassorhabdomicrobium marinisediminis]|uniref:Cbb3-type cytochrome oxidase assembly protein CcoS n=1 Tax=Thalassorhabdomicrobium marinisediminis TaxID=2170577 RepID=A0A2T7FVU3_9RHOB|nr:cbb3-type cytochrome oxidase assembly protein CcoS [Thalassorhabdomicrobium marinisediminis]PVA06272.1 cbb3-type cytochrome oxidase assembly protein CcoS [Thalassorhabdomicrobium marinisediminis]
MNVLAYLIPVSLVLGGLGLLAFWWTLRSDQYDDPEGDSARILRDDYDDYPAETPQSRPKD